MVEIMVKCANCGADLKAVLGESYKTPCCEICAPKWLSSEDFARLMGRPPDTLTSAPQHWHGEAAFMPNNTVVQGLCNNQLAPQGPLTQLAQDALLSQLAANYGVLMPEAVRTADQTDSLVREAELVRRMAQDEVVFIVPTLDPIALLTAERDAAVARANEIFRDMKLWQSRALAAEHRLAERDAAIFTATGKRR